MRTFPTIALPWKAAAATALAALLSAPLPADELRLADGRVLVGKVRTMGDSLEVTTRDGVVTVAAALVVSRRTDAELRAELKQLAGSVDDTPHTRLQLARTAQRYGLTNEMWQHLDRCCEAVDGDGDSAVARQLRRFLAKLLPEVLPPNKRQGDADKRVRALVRKVRSGTGAAQRAAILELLVGEEGADAALQDQARRGLLPEQRLVAIAALQRRPTAGNDRFVFRRTILDKDKDVRRQVAEMIAAEGDAEGAIRYLAPGFLNDRPFIRMHTAEAYADIGDARAVPYLVAAGPLAGVTRAAANGGGPGVRAHMFSTTQRAYIRDFDVEIAQAAAVANPQVGTVTNGVVLDATVGAVVAMRGQILSSYRRALKRLTGTDPGRHPAEWRFFQNTARGTPSGNGR